MPLLTGSGELATSVRTKINNLINYVLEYGRFAKDVNTMLASSGFTYSTLSLKSVVAGDLIKTVRGGLVFQVLPIGATNYDHVLPSGVLLSLQEGSDGWYDFDGMAPFKDGVTDNLAKLNTLIANKSQTISLGDWLGPSIRFPVGRFYFSASISPKSRVRFHGQSTGFTGGRGTDFIFPPATAGIIVNRHNTLGEETVAADSGAADGSEFVGINFFGGRGSAFDNRKSGIWMRARAEVRNCAFAEFAGHGVYAGAGSDGNPYLGNCNLFRVSRIWVTGCRGSAFAAEGTDANAGSAEYVDGNNNDGWGIYENSFLGNHHEGHHSQSNLLGSYFSRNQSALINSYAEDGVGGTAYWGGIQFGSMISAHNKVGNAGLGTAGQAPILSVEYANGQRGMRNDNGGYIGTRGNMAASLGTQDGTIVYGQHTANQTPFRIGTYVNGAIDTVIRWGSNARNLILFTGIDTLLTFGRSAPVPQATNIQEVWLGLNNQARMITFGGGPPTSGNYATGDIIFSNGSGAGGKVGWYCVASGSPGTWKPFGAIDP